MSALTYLQKRVIDAVVPAAEIALAESVVVTLRARIDRHFRTGLSGHFRFGSSVRGTVLPRSLDERADIDYMVVFEDISLTPRDCLGQLQRFLASSYWSIDTLRSKPTVAFETKRVRLDLVPALRDRHGGYRIPNGLGDWKSTNPEEFGRSLDDADTYNKYLIRPTVKLAKMWNAKSGYLFEPFHLESWVMGQSYRMAINQADHLFVVFDSLNTRFFDEQWRRDEVEAAKRMVNRIRHLENGGHPDLAEAEMRKLLPE